MVVSCARGKSFNHRSIGEGTWIIVASGLLRVRMAMTETTRSRAESVGAEACVRLAMVHGKSGGQSDSTFSKARYDLVAETDTTCLLLTTHNLSRVPLECLHLASNKIRAAEYII